MMKLRVTVTKFIVVLLGIFCRTSHASPWTSGRHRNLLHQGGFHPTNGITCSATEFLSRTKECVECDPKCVKGGCLDFFGCVSCKPGYFTIQSGKDRPFTCRLCTVPGCAHCEEAQLEGSVARCAECIDGFELVNEFTRCKIAVQRRANQQGDVVAFDGMSWGAETSSASQTVSSETQITTSGTTPATSLAGAARSEERSTPPNRAGAEIMCPFGYVLRRVDLSCEECDNVCLPGACTNFIGCSKCPLGYFTSRRDAQFPFKCRLCDIPSCAQCQGGIIDGLPPRCIKCEDGHVSIDGGLQCIGRAAQGVAINPGSPSQTGATPVCNLDQFSGADGVCYACDARCTAGSCVRDEGCSKCQSGYFKRKVTAGGFFTCQECEIFGCDECEEDASGGGRTQCKKCSESFSLEAAEGSCRANDSSTGTFENRPGSASASLPTATSHTSASRNDRSEETLLNKDSTVSREDSATSAGTSRCSEKVDTESGQSSVASRDIADAEMGLGRLSEAKGTDLQGTSGASVDSKKLSCPDGYFSRTRRTEQACAPCDAHCMVDQCIDIFGCLKCEPGYTVVTSREDLALSCSPCEIPHCQECLGVGLRSSEQICYACKPGYALTADRSQCNASTNEGKGTLEPPTPSTSDSMDKDFSDYIEDDMTQKEDVTAFAPMDADDMTPVSAPDEELL